MEILLEKVKVLPAWTRKTTLNVSLNTAGLVVLAELPTIAERTALTGGATYLDALVLCPGIHCQQGATSLNGAEYPATAALTTGYVFRIENQATVYYLQKVGKTGHLTNVTVEKLHKTRTIWTSIRASLYPSNMSTGASAFYFAPQWLTITALSYLVSIEDWWAVATLVMLILARLCNIAVIRRRATTGWKGASEPGVSGDLLVLLSQDRWIRIRGLVDDLKTVTSGQWLRDMTFFESSVVAAATLAVYLSVVVASNSSQAGQFVLPMLFICSVGLLALSNSFTDTLQMHEHVVRAVGSPVAYARRRDLANELVKESGRSDWAVRLGMIVQEAEESDFEKGKASVQSVYEEEVTM